MSRLLTATRQPRKKQQRFSRNTSAQRMIFTLQSANIISSVFLMMKAVKNPSQQKQNGFAQSLTKLLPIPATSRFSFSSILILLLPFTAALTGQKWISAWCSRTIRRLLTFQVTPTMRQMTPVQSIRVPLRLSAAAQ